MPPKPTTNNESTTLLTTTQTTQTLLYRFLSALDTQTPPAATPTPLDFSPLTLLAQSSSLIRAHTTKLSLLLLNKPFTPSAIRKVLEQMTKEALPGMAAGVQLMQGRRGTHGGIMVEEVVVRARRVYRELMALVDEVTAMVKAESSGSDAETKKNRDTLASTGVLWAACDGIGELERMGVPGLLVKKAGLWREMLEDAIAELREWSEGADDDDEDEEEDDDDDEIAASGDEASSSSSAGDDLATLLNTSTHLPKARPDLKATLDLALRQLKLTSTLYAAITKRRLKTLVVSNDTTTASSTMTKVDALLEKLKQIPEETDELASAFYDLDDGEARKVLEGICGVGRECVELVEKGWDGEEDEFTKWSGKWREAIEKADV